NGFSSDLFASLSSPPPVSVPPPVAHDASAPPSGIMAAAASDPCTNRLRLRGFSLFMVCHLPCVVFVGGRAGDGSASPGATAVCSDRGPMIIGDRHIHSTSLCLPHRPSFPVAAVRRMYCTP